MATKSLERSAIGYIPKTHEPFKIKSYSDPHKPGRMKIMSESYKHDENGKRQKRQGNDGYLMQQMEIDNFVVVPGAKQIFTPPRRYDNKRLLTGLDVEIDNPYSDMDYYPNEKFEKYLKGKKRVKLQHVLEMEDDVEFDYYTSDIPEDILPKSIGTRKFWQTQSRFYSLSNGITYLNMDIPSERLIYYAMMARSEKIAPVVARNWEELLELPGCKWYVVDEEEKQSVILSRTEKENSITYGIETLKRHKKNTALAIMAKALECRDANDSNLSADKAYLILNQTTKSDKEIGNLFLEYFDMWQDNSTRPLIESYAEIFDMVRYQVVMIDNSKYKVKLRDKDGNTEFKLFSSKKDFAQKFLLDPAFQEEVAQVRVQLKAAQ